MTMLIHCALVFVACIGSALHSAEDTDMPIKKEMSIEQTQTAFKDARTSEQTIIKNDVAYITSIPSMGIEVLFDYAKRQLGIRLASPRVEKHIAYGTSDFYLGMPFSKAKECPSLKKTLHTADTGAGVLDDDDNVEVVVARSSVFDDPEAGVALEFDKQHNLVEIRLLAIPAVNKAELDASSGIKMGMTLDEIRKMFSDKVLREKTMEQTDLERKERYLLQIENRFFLFDEKKKLLRVEQGSSLRRP